MYGFWGSKLDLHLLPINFKEALALCNVFYKVYQYPLLLFPAISKKQVYCRVSANDVKNAIVHNVVSAKTYIVNKCTCLYNRIALRFRFKLINIPEPVVKESPSPPEIENTIEQVKDNACNIEPYEKQRYSSTKTMIEQYLALRNKHTNISFETTQYLVKLPNNNTCVFTSLEMETYFTHKALLFANVNNIELIAIPRDIPDWILYMFQGKRVPDCSYFLKMSYNIRKYLLPSIKPCKKVTLFKIMEHLYNNYEVCYDHKTDMINLYMDVIDKEYVDADTFDGILRFLGYTVTNGQIMHMRKRQTPKEVNITTELTERKDMEPFNHKMLNIGGSDLRGAPKNPYYNVSPFNIASI